MKAVSIKFVCEGGDVRYGVLDQEHSPYWHAPVVVEKRVADVYVPSSSGSLENQLDTARVDCPICEEHWARMDREVDLTQTMQGLESMKRVMVELISGVPELAEAVVVAATERTLRISGDAEMDEEFLERARAALASGRFSGDGG